jgi:hypothetical protein
MVMKVRFICWRLAFDASNKYSLGAISERFKTGAAFALAAIFNEEQKFINE